MGTLTVIFDSGDDAGSELNQITHSYSVAMSTDFVANRLDRGKMSSPHLLTSYSDNSQL